MNRELAEQIQTTHKNCAIFMKKLQQYSIYPQIKQLLFAWKGMNKKNIVAIDTFMRISHIIHEEGKDQKLSEFFNECLIKQALVPKKINSNGNNSNSGIPDLDELQCFDVKTDKNKNIRVPRAINKSTSRGSKDKNRITANNLSGMDEEEDDGEISDNQSSYNINQGSRGLQGDEYGVTRLNKMLRNNSYSQNKQILQNFSQWVHKQTKNNPKDQKQPKIEKQKKQSGCSVQKNISNPITIEPLTPQKFREELYHNKHSQELSKLISLYLKSIITLQQIKLLLLQALFHQQYPSVYHYLIKYCQQIEAKRQKITIFAPLNQLVDRKYPLEQVDSSYVLVPDGYANYSKKRATFPNQHLLNRKYVSVPLGSQVNFIINKKTQYEEQLFYNEEQRYQIDSNLQCFKYCIKLITKYRDNPSLPKRLESPTLKRIVGQMYPTIENIYSIFINYFELAETILLPRLEQKYSELVQLKDKFKKVSEEVCSKNFYKSLDYRCYYFVKNDKKFNSAARWIEEVALRKKEIIDKEHRMEIQSQQKSSNEIKDREQLQHTREYCINTFENVTTLPLLPSKFINIFQYDRKLSATYPKFPNNQILFILNFSNLSTLNDVLQILLYHCNPNKKRILQLLVFRLMHMNIRKNLKKYNRQHFSKIEENNQKLERDQDSDSLEEFGSQNKLSNSCRLNNALVQDNNAPRLLTNRNTSTKSSEDQFLEMIQEEIQSTYINNKEYDPFEGPENGFTFIGTKTIYILVRYILTIYQRFLKAKQYSMNDSPSSQNSLNNQAYEQYPQKYKYFISLYTSSLSSPSITANQKQKQKKTIEQQLRKIYQNNAFIFFTLQKLVQSTVKLINSITNQSLTYKILKEGTKDYEKGLFQWDKFEWKNVNEQLIRLYTAINRERNDKGLADNQGQNKQADMLFRFTYAEEDNNFFVSAWNPVVDGSYSKQDSMKIWCNMNIPIFPEKVNQLQTASNYKNNEQIILLSDQILLRGQSTLVHPQRISLLNPPANNKTQTTLNLSIRNQEDKPQKKQSQPIKIIQSQQIYKKCLKKQIQKLKIIQHRCTY